MKRWTILVWILFLSINAFATAQRPDKIIYQGQTYSLHSNPMEAYFSKHPDKKPKTSQPSTALWRGYVATFEFKDEELFLKDIEVKYRDTIENAYKWRSVLEEVFPEGENLKIDWLTGLLVIPYGELVNYVHMGYGSTYENYILLEIDKGDFKKEKRLSYDEYLAFKEKQFQAFKKTEEYAEIKAKLRKKENNASEAFIDSFLKTYIIKYTSKILTD